MNLSNLRKQIDKIDDKIIPLLEKRLKLALATKKYKLRIKDSKREEEILSKIDSKYIKDIYKSIFKNSKKAQSEEKCSSKL